jgi:hypothetical protein
LAQNNQVTGNHFFTGTAKLVNCIHEPLLIIALTGNPESISIIFFHFSDIWSVIWYIQKFTIGCYGIKTGGQEKKAVGLV